MKKNKLQNKEISKLKKLHRKIKDKRIADKIKAVILLGKGKKSEEISEILFLDKVTIRRYKKIYDKYGIEGLLIKRYKGRKPKLTEEEEKILVTHLKENVYTSSKPIVLYVEKEFGITYTKEGIVLVLHRLGFTYKKTKSLPSKGDKDKQKEFVKSYKELKKDLKGNEGIYFMDGCHPTHNTILNRGWIMKGEEKEIKSNTGRERLNINGVYSPITGEVIVREDKSINAQSTIELLKEIERNHPELEKIYIIRDNAKYYKCKLVDEFLKTSKIEMIALPSYSPNLNLIERLWKFLKKMVLYNKYYEKFEQFKDTVMNFLNKDIKNYKRELISLMRENFHIVSN